MMRMLPLLKPLEASEEDDDATLEASEDDTSLDPSSYHS